MAESDWRVLVPGAKRIRLDRPHDTLERLLELRHFGGMLLADIHQLQRIYVKVIQGGNDLRFIQQ